MKSNSQSVFADYWELTKPRIALTVVITQFSGIWLASGAEPEWANAFLAMLGTWMASASSGLLNNYVDRDIDPLMERTKNRALAAGRVSANSVLVLGLGVGLCSLLLLGFAVNWLTAWLGVFTTFFYVVIYAKWLKRTSPLCTSVGGIAGAMPPVMGWTAVTGQLEFEALALFGIMFVWQPPHFWALAIAKKEEYRKAGIPMLPVVHGDRRTQVHMLLWTIVLLPATFSLYATRVAGPVFLAVAAIMTGLYIGKTLIFMRNPITMQSCRSLFFFSLWWLLAVYGALVLDKAPAAITGLL